MNEIANLFGYLDYKHVEKKGHLLFRANNIKNVVPILFEGSKKAKIKIWLSQTGLIFLNFQTKKE